MNRLLKRQEGESEVAERQRASTWGWGVGYDDRNCEVGGPQGALLGMSSLEQPMRLVPGVGDKEVPANWKQLLLLGPSAAGRGRSIATVTSGTNRSEQKGARLPQLPSFQAPWNSQIRPR